MWPPHALFGGGFGGVFVDGADFSRTGHFARIFAKRISTQHAIGARLFATVDQQRRTTRPTSRGAFVSSLTLSKSQAASSIARMKSTLSTWREKANEQTEHVVGIATTAVAGYGLGLADARFGEDAVWGMSTSLATAIIGHGLAMFEVGGQMPAQLFRSAGNAGLSIYAYKSGFEMGSRGR